jgi:hypothetical protein
MSTLRLIISSVLAVVFLYFTITALQDYLVANDELVKAENEYDIAKSEYDNVVKYGCTNPVVNPGLVSCP